MALPDQTEPQNTEQRPIKLAHLFFTALGTIVTVVGLVLAITEAQRSADQKRIDERLRLHVQSFERQFDALEDRLDRMNARNRQTPFYRGDGSGEP